MIDLLQQYILEPMSYDFMQRALIASISVGVVCAIFSCFLILKGWALIGDAVSHAVLPGLAIAYVIGLPLVVGAFCAGLLCAWSIGYIKNHSRVKEDAVMGIVFSGMFALGLVMLTHIESDIHLMHILFGNILGITKADLTQTTTIAGFCTAIMIFKRKDFMLYCYDISHAKVIGLPVQFLHFGLLALLSLTIVSAIKSAGIILVIGMLITPGAIGFLIARSFGAMMIIAIAASVLSCILGTLISFHIDAATAPLIICIQSALCFCALIYNVLHQNAAPKRKEIA